MGLPIDGTRDIYVPEEIETLRTEILRQVKAAGTAHRSAGAAATALIILGRYDFDGTTHLNKTIPSGVIPADATTGKPEIRYHFSISQLAAMLIDVHDNKVAGARASAKTNAEFLDRGVAAITARMVEDALASPKGYADADGFRAWQGAYDGNWYNDQGHTGTDPALWYEPFELDPILAPTDVTQAVTFFWASVSGAPGKFKYRRTGWNRSEGTKDHVWGWDPKGIYNGMLRHKPKGAIGTHVGFTFEMGAPIPASGIVWITPQEAFLEIVQPDPNGGPAKRTSAGIWGFGQWVLRPIN